MPERSRRKPGEVYIDDDLEEMLRQRRIMLKTTFPMYCTLYKCKRNKDGQCILIRCCRHSHSITDASKCADFKQRS